MNKNSLILVTGGSGLVGSSITRKLKQLGYTNVYSPNSKSLDLVNCSSVQGIIDYQPDFIFHCASLVGGIGRNIKYPADFGIKNSLINNNVILGASAVNSKLLFMGSSCIYPRECPQPMKEEYILSGKCEPTNEMYALSKLFGVKLCEAYYKQYDRNFISCLPCNIYGEGDHFDIENSHVVGALINKFHDAKVKGLESISMWGTGLVRRELMYVDDLADASILLMNYYNKPEPINIGTGVDVTIKELAEMISKIIGYSGEITWDHSKPDGMPRKVLDISKIKDLSWGPSVSLYNGLEKTYKWYLENII